MADPDNTAPDAEAAAVSAAAAVKTEATDEPPPSPSSSAPPSPPPNPPSTLAAPVLPENFLTLALPSPNAPPPVPPPLSPSAASARRIPPPCWTHEETLTLIDAYGAKWVALRRGNLRTAHWEEVARDLEARARDLPGAKTKTPMQCRHKMEKLRKRYRSERQRSLKAKPRTPPKSSWVYFRRMHALEFGGGPNPGLPPAHRPVKGGNWDSDREEPFEPEEEADEVEDDAGGRRYHVGLRDPATKANGIGHAPSPLRIRIPKATRTNRTGDGFTNDGAAAAWTRPSFQSLPSIPSNGRTGFRGKTPGSRPQFLHDNKVSNRRWEGGSAERKNRTKGKRARAEDEVVVEAEDQKPLVHASTTNRILQKVVAAVRMLGDGFMRMEQMKLDMAREFERARMDIELKHTEMMLQSQRRILDCMIKGITDSKQRRDAT